MQQKVKWWLLYAIIPLSLGLLWLDSQFRLQPLAHRWLEVGIVLVSFGLMALWVRANQGASAQASCRPIVYSLRTDPNHDQMLNWASGRHKKPRTNLVKREITELERHN